MSAREIAFSVLKEAEKSYSEHGKFSDETLQGLHDVFGEVLLRAAEFLETGDVVRYRTADGVRTVRKVSNKRESFLLFDNVNFCYCPRFVRILRDRDAATCQHVLSSRLAEISGRARVDVLTDSQYVDLVGDLAGYIKD